MLLWFIRLLKFTEFLFHLGKTPFKKNCNISHEVTVLLGVVYGNESKAVQTAQR